MKQVKAGDDWSSSNYILTADQSQYPSPLSGTLAVPIDRVFVSGSTFGPDQGFVVRLDVPGIKASAGDGLANIYFCGPAGLVPSGIGQYALCLGANGTATLYESTGSSWVKFGSKSFGPKQRSGGSTQFVYVQPCTKTLNPGLSGVLSIEFEQVKQSPVISGSHSPLVSSIQDVRQWQIGVPASSAVAQPVPIRLDVRRDMRLGWQISTLDYPPSATLQDDAFSLPFFATSSQPLILAWFSDLPLGCTVTGQLYDANTNAALSQVGSIGGFPMYQADYPQRTFYAKFTLIGTQTLSPTLFGYRVQRDAVIVPSTLTPFEISPFVQEVESSQSGPESGGWAKVRLADFQGSVAAQLGRGQRRIRIETEFDPTQPTARAGLFDGEVCRPILNQRGFGSGVFPNPQWGEIELNAIGALSRLTETVSPIRFDYGLDFNSLNGAGHPTPYLVTEALESLFALCGYSGSQLNMPSSTVRLFASSDPQGLIIEPQVRVGELIIRWCREYLDCRPYFDPDSSQWNFLPLAGSGSPVATFQSAGPTGYAQINNIQSYPPGTFFIRKGSLSTWIEPPLANAIIGYGVSASVQGFPRVIIQTAVNVAGLEFDGTTPPTLGIDYLERFKPLFVAFPGQTTEEGLGWMVRRAYDQFAHGKTGWAWQSPMALLSNGSGGQRALRPGDLISINGASAILTEVRLAISKDEHQLADYQAETVPA